MATTFRAAYARCLRTIEAVREDAEADCRMVPRDRRDPLKVAAARAGVEGAIVQCKSAVREVKRAYTNRLLSDPVAVKLVDDLREMLQQVLDRKKSD